MEEFKSKLQDEPIINYNKEFESEELNEEDIDKEVFLYKITIFGNRHYIAMGNRKVHSENENIVYFVAYLVHEKKVVSKIGLYEYLKDELGEEEPNFSEGELLVNPKYYKQPFLLNAFKIGDVELYENKGAENISEETYIFMENGTLNLVEQPDTRKFDLIKSISLTEASIESRTLLKNALLKNISLFTKYCIIPNISGSTSYIDAKLKGLKKISLVSENKKVTYGYEKIIQSGKSYELNELLLLSLEIVLNIKFLVLDDTMKLTSLNFIDNYKFSDYIPIIDTEIPEFKKDEKKQKQKEEFMSALNNYNPEKIIFLQKKENKFVLLSHLDNVMINISDLDNKTLGLLKFLYEEYDHFYKYDSQLISLKELFKDVEIPDILKEDEEDQEEEEEEQSRPAQEPSGPAEEPEEEQSGPAEKPKEEQSGPAEKPKANEPPPPPSKQLSMKEKIKAAKAAAAKDTSNKKTKTKTKTKLSKNDN